MIKAELQKRGLSLYNPSTRDKVIPLLASYVRMGVSFEIGSGAAADIFTNVAASGA